MSISILEKKVRFPFFLATCVVVGIAVVTAAQYVRAGQVMEGEIRERLRSTAAVAAMQFNGDQLSLLRTSQDIHRPVFHDIVDRLNQIREDISNIEYAYIMRQTEDPYTLEFVADADSLIPKEELDENGNGIIDPEEELSFPGDPYDVSAIPIMQNEAFVRPTVDDEITYDQWGSYISGYAPIRNSAGEVVAILGLDMSAQDFIRISNSVFSGISLILLGAGAFLAGIFIIMLTWKHRIDTLREVDRERGALVGLALHQLGTPLSIFRWWLEIVQDKYGDTVCKETDACTQLAEGIELLQNVYNDLQSAHTVSRGRLSYSLEKVSLRSILQGEVDLLSKKLEQKQQTVDIDIPEDIIMQLDSRLIGGVVSELLENASAFSPRESKITVSAVRRKHDAVVSVRDEGCGISQRDLPHVFKKLVRGDHAYKYKSVGNGIGLYVAKGIVEEAGGKIWIESKEGRGTAAFFSLPLSRKQKKFRLF